MAEATSRFTTAMALDTATQTWSTKNLDPPSAVFYPASGKQLGGYRAQNSFGADHINRDGQYFKLFQAVRFSGAENKESTCVHAGRVIGKLGAKECVVRCIYVPKPSPRHEVFVLLSAPDDDDLRSVKLSNLVVDPKYSDVSYDFHEHPLAWLDHGNKEN
jgi:hypothetical protein